MSLLASPLETRRAKASSLPHTAPPAQQAPRLVRGGEGGKFSPPARGGVAPKVTGWWEPARGGVAAGPHPTLSRKRERDL
jgi:hypothetical protein